jgi:photosystem II stability/assembly factor-like uncharacterized protein
MIAALPLSAQWRLSGPFGGSARSIAIDAQDSKVLLAGARDSLLFRSDDAGLSWRLLPFSGSTPGTFAALIIDPKQSSHYYAGLDAGETSDSGVYESQDGGEHWTPSPGLRGMRIESLAIAPSDPHTIAAGTAKGIFVSNDAGQTWRRISNATNPEMQDITALAFHPTDVKQLYAGTPHLPWRTLDGGANWHSIRTGLIDDSDIFSIRVNPKRPELLFASACSGIYRSDTAGESWTKLRGIPGTHRRTHIIAEDPRDPDTVFAGTTLGLFKTPDGGKTWQHLNNEQVNWMVFDPSDPKVMYLATEYAGILKTADAGATFQHLNQGFSNHSLTQITGSGKRLYASSIYEGRYGGVFTSEDGGLNWNLRANQEALLGRNLHSLISSPSGDELFAASADGILKSTDGAKTWTLLPAQPRIRPARPFRIHSLRAVQLQKLTLFAGTDKGLFRWVSGAAAWDQVKGAGIEGVQVLAVYAPVKGSSWLALRTSGGVFISADSGTTWRLAPLPDSSYFVYDIALPVDKSGQILAATSRGLLQSTDGGASWKLAGGYLPSATVTAVHYHPDRKQEAYLIQYGNVFRSLDGGATWNSLPGGGLENASVRALGFVSNIPARIIALSAARGALTFDLPEAQVAGQAGTQAVSTKER